MFDPQKIKNDFPILRRFIDGKRIVYLDNAATAQHPRSVISAMDDFYLQHNANIHRGIYQLSEEATASYDLARHKVAHFIHAASKEEIIFTRNTTESLNLVAMSYALQHLQTGDEIVLSDLEHHSNLLPWQRVAQLTRAKLVFLETTDDGINDTELNKITTKTKIVAITHASNVTGSVLPIEKIIAAAHRVHALTCIDGAQAAPHLPVDVQQLGCDFYAFSGHKMLGPMGIGVLFARQEIQAEMQPYQLGGGMIDSVRYESAQFLTGPEKFEAGTPNVAGAIGLAAAIDYLENIGLINIRAHELGLTTFLLKELQQIPQLHLLGSLQPEKRTGLVSFYLDKIHAHDIAAFLDQQNIAIRAGFHCVMPYHEKHHYPATARISYYLYNDQNDLAFLLTALQALIKLIG